ncbi:MAG: DUF3972 domain-containing protein [Campylobacterales bacterium]|nr:DUF3972 domain-containing protein [Campylobacterales bacterium]
MSKLIKPAQYAKKYNISRQAVYAKVKRGTLQSKEVEGQLFIVLNASEDGVENSKVEMTNVSRKTVDIEQHYSRLLQSKDETIITLQARIEDLKESNEQMAGTLRGEVELLKEAFYEMKHLYRAKLESKKEAIAIEAKPKEIVVQDWVSIKKFFTLFDIKEKKQKKIKERIKKAYLGGDNRLKMSNDKIKIDIGRDCTSFIS